MPAVSPYTSVDPFAKAPATHIPADALDDVARVRAYETYEEVYDNLSSIFASTLKIDAGNDIYRRLIPTARSIIEAINRYLARGLSWVAKPPEAASATAPAAGEGAAGAAEEAVAATMATLEALFAREEFGAKFLSLKRWMLIRADALLHVSADPTKPEGTRIRITELNPGSYFALEDPGDSERVIGCYIVNVVLDDDGEEIAARLEYRRIVDADSASAFSAPLGSVFAKLTFWEKDGWDDRRSEEDLAPLAAPARFGGDRFTALLAGAPLPAAISAIPVYHFRNRRRGGRLYGVSELQGLETLICGINQTATDQEVAIALNGLGVYTTDSGSPRDEQGNIVDWQISPASVLELNAKGDTFNRVAGVTSVQPSLDHIKLLKSEGREAAATPDIAVGQTEVAVAESGVALGIQLAPMVANKEEKEEEIISKLTQLLFDLLNGWLPAYEGIQPNGTTVTPIFDDAIPKNRQQIIADVVALVTAKVVSAAWARSELASELGFVFSLTEGDDIAAEGAATLDATGARMDAALAAPDVQAEVGL